MFIHSKEVEIAAPSIPIKGIKIRFKIMLSRVNTTVIFRMNLVFLNTLSVISVGPNIDAINIPVDIIIRTFQPATYSNPNIISIIVFAKKIKKRKVGYVRINIHLLIVLKV